MALTMLFILPVLLFKMFVSSIYTYYEGSGYA